MAIPSFSLICARSEVLIRLRVKKTIIASSGRFLKFLSKNYAYRHKAEEELRWVGFLLKIDRLGSMQLGVFTVRDLLICSGLGEFLSMFSIDCDE